MAEHPSPDVARLMAGVVASRQQMWTLVHEVVARPDGRVAERLAGSDWVDDFRQAVQWLGDAAEKFSPGLRAVELVATGSTDESGAAPGEGATTLEELRSGHEVMTATARVDVADVITDLLAQLVAEERAWANGDDERAKDLRLAQHGYLNQSVTPAIQQWCYDALNQQASPTLSALMRVVVVVLSVETGRDFERAMQGRDFHIADDMLR